MYPSTIIQLTPFSPPSHIPLGKVFTTEELGSIGKLCISHNLILVADEVYEHLAYGSPFSRVANLEPAIAARTLSAVSLCKLFNATRWRVRFVIGPWELLRHVQAAHLVLAYYSSSPEQEAMAVGLKEAEGNGFWESNRQDIKTKVGRICDILDELGLSYVAPAGGYFVFVNIDKIALPLDYPFPASVLSRASKDWKVSTASDTRIWGNRTSVLGLQVG